LKELAILTMVGIIDTWYGVGTVALLASMASGLPQDSFPDCSKGPLSKLEVCNTSLDPSTRAKALVDALTFEEKINNTQNDAPGVPRLGLPPYNWWGEALHGVAGAPGVWFAPNGPYSYATSFPCPIVMGAAFNDPMVKEIASVISTEARAFSNAARAPLDYWTPNINPFRDPRWGRGQETPGEDPFHNSQYTYHLIDGLQNGIGPENPKIVATCKHFAAYDMENWHGHVRHAFNAIVSAQDMSEYYMPPFRTCARDAKVDSVMCSYNAVNGVPTCADPYLLETILRDRWEWEAPGRWVTSDCGAIDDILNGHHYAETGAQAVAYALNAGTDLDCGTMYPEHLGAAAAQGLYANATLDTALVRLYASLVKLGYFDPAEGQPYRSIGWEAVGTAHAEKLAHQAAVEGVVLLKNDEKQILPMPRSGQSIALVGPYANATTQLQGNYEGPPKYIRTMIWAAQQLGYKVNFVYGTGINSTSTAGFADAVSAAKDADLVIYAGGIDNSIEAETNDRNSITWPGNQLDLMDQLSKVGKPMVVVQFGGGQVDDSSLLTNTGINALLWAGYPSQAGGAAVFDVLTGISAPAGRLATTQYPADYVNEVPMTDMNLRPGDNNPGRTYRWYDKAVLPFGFGLHYTTFDVSFASRKLRPYNTEALVHASHHRGPKDTALFDTFGIQVTNSGKVASDYVALLFLTTTDAGPEPYPIKTLVGYTRAIAIQPGETRTVRIDVTLGSLARTNEQGDLVLYPGSYKLEVDVDKELRPTASFKVHGPEQTLDHFPQSTK
jgi:beta-D-xylosidase 4